MFKTKTFDRWAKKVISDQLLCVAAREIEQGLYEVDLGHGVCKKLVGRQKSEPGPDFPDGVVTAAKAIADGLHRQKIERLAELAAQGQLKEICSGKEEDQ